MRIFILFTSLMRLTCISTILFTRTIEVFETYKIFKLINKTNTKKIRVKQLLIAVVISSEIRK